MQKIIEEIIIQSIKNLQQNNVWSDFDIPIISVERPKDFTHGDWMINSAFELAQKVHRSPLEIATDLSEEINKGNSEIIKKCVVAGPGFINVTVSAEYLQNIVNTIMEKGESFGDNDSKKGLKINNEFISANPTGPLHLGNGRGGFLGDALGNILQKNGATVIKEYYINDAGEQVVKLGHSVLKDEEAVYAGEYIDDLNSEVLANESVDKSNVKKVGVWAADKIVNKYLKQLTSQSMQINFDSWISEKKDIIDNDYVQKAIDLLKEKSLTFEKDDALWLKTTNFGDDKDRVLIKGDGQKTYFASDCGYILNKIERGFNNIIEIWGADHHGYINRFKAATQALGFDGEVDFLIVQLVRLMKDGKEVRMSKRAGNVVYVNELIDEVGHDATRFFFLMQSPDSHMDFDLALAKEKSSKNPVYYVQYAHARLISIIEKSRELSITDEQIERGDVALLVTDKERELMRELEIFNEVILDIAETYSVHHLPQYAITLAEKFHAFYTECRVVDESDIPLSLARLKLVKSTQIVISQTLKLIGVSAPKSM